MILYHIKSQKAIKHCKQSVNFALSPIFIHKKNFNLSAMRRIINSKKKIGRQQKYFWRTRKMIDSLKSQIADWKYGRGLVKSFVEQLSDDDLDKPLPRKTLNTIRQQCVELIQVQTCYVNALTTKYIHFDYENISDVSKKSMLKLMDELDIKLEKILDNFDGTEKIKWFSDEWNIHQHISAMIGHEQMHIGQIVAFCYATEIHIPDSITNTMTLSG